MDGLADTTVELQEHYAEKSEKPYPTFPYTLTLKLSLLNVPALLHGGGCLHLRYLLMSLGMIPLLLPHAHRTNSISRIPMNTIIQAKRTDC